MNNAIAKRLVTRLDAFIAMVDSMQAKLDAVAVEAEAQKARIAELERRLAETGK